MTHLEIQYNLWLVALSFVIAVISSFSALNLAGKISNSTGKTKILWLLSGSCVMGCGVWSMHFIGMLATHIAIPVYYDPTMTALSAIASVIASLIAFLVTSDQQPSKWRIGLGGMVMGSGIVIMHYSGMAAIQSAATLSHDPLLLAVSILIAMLTSYSALYLFRRFRNKPQYHLWKLFCSVLMGLAIGGMHYTGMAASSFHLHGDIHVESHLNEYNFSLIASVSIVTFLILFISLIAVFFDHHILERMAFYDYLTDLPNRYGLVQYFDLQFNLTESGAILFIDIDRFKTINDTLGHDVGDMLIQQIAKRLRNCIGEKDKVFRLGGDEFLIASPDGDEKTAVLLADRILHEIKKPCYIEDHELYVTASIGISLAPIHGFDRSSLMKWADTAMYHAKNEGKNKASVFNEEMGLEQVRRLELEKDLRKALEHQEFAIVYQTKWNSSTNQMVGMEALLRWNHPKLGTISPIEFIPIAEETGLIVPITHWVIEEVCKQNQLWHEQNVAQVTVSVNMSVRVFENQTLFQVVKKSLDLSGLNPIFLELEVTESIAMNDMENTISQLQRIRELGVKVSLDDFGTGFSSLGNLDEMPIDILKIDKSFIRKSMHPSKQAIISNIIMIAKSLNMEVVAEGVETKEQIDFLTSRGCTIMQGFYYAKPVPPEEIAQQDRPLNQNE